MSLNIKWLLVKHYGFKKLERAGCKNKTSEYLMLDSRQDAATPLTTSGDAAAEGKDIKT